jgi:hypothetical protein
LGFKSNFCSYKCHYLKKREFIYDRYYTLVIKLLDKIKLFLCSYLPKILKDIQTGFYICNHRDDREEMRSFVTLFENEYTIRISHEISQHEQKFEKLIEKSKLFIFYLSQNFLDEKTCTDQLSYAIKLNKKVFYLTCSNNYNSLQSSLDFSKCIKLEFKRENQQQIKNYIHFGFLRYFKIFDLKIFWCVLASFVCLNSFKQIKKRSLKIEVLKLFYNKILIYIKHLCTLIV